MIAIKNTGHHQTLLISFDGSKRYTVPHQLLKDAGLKLGTTCKVVLDKANNEPRILTSYQHPSNLRFVVHNCVVEIVGSRAILRKGVRSHFFESKTFGRVACIHKDVAISNINNEYPIKVSLILEKDKVGENSMCHWAAVIDDNYEKPTIKAKQGGTKMQKQCTGVITKVDTNDKNLKTYWCWLTEEHSSSAVFETRQKPLKLQRGDFFQANFEKPDADSKWNFFSFLRVIPSLTTVRFFNDTISLSVCLQKIKKTNSSIEAYHPLVGTIVDVWDVLKSNAKNGVTVSIISHCRDGKWGWAIAPSLD